MTKPKAKQRSTASRRRARVHTRGSSSPSCWWSSASPGSSTTTSRCGSTRPLVPAPEPGSPAFMADLGNWNYLIGFGLFLLGLAVSAHPSTPLGRGRGVVVGMLGLLPHRAAVDLHVLRVQRRPVGDPGHERPRPVQPDRRHRLHGRRLHLRHPLGVTGRRPSVPGRRAGGRATCWCWSCSAPRSRSAPGSAAPARTRRDAAARDLTRADPVPLSDVLGPDDAFPGDRVGQPVTVRRQLDPRRARSSSSATRATGWSPRWRSTEPDAALPVVRGVSDDADRRPGDGDGGR